MPLTTQLGNGRMRTCAKAPMFTQMLTKTWNLNPDPLPTSPWPQRTLGAERGPKGTGGSKQRRMGLAVSTPASKSLPPSAEGSRSPSVSRCSWLSGPRLWTQMTPLSFSAAAPWTRGSIITGGAVRIWRDSVEL